jgi:hypothetical protein
MPLPKKIKRKYRALHTYISKKMKICMEKSKENMCGYTMHARIKFEVQQSFIGGETKK